jgi:uncharacterized protein (DUF362 family)/Pyruvate/2-oxoacid:ferredoxin oxidoreductase delta subunit
MKVFVNEIKKYDLPEIIKIFRQNFAEIDLWTELETKKIILLKPNLLGPYHPEEAVTTHPVIIEAVIILLQEKNKEVWLGDSPGGSVAVKTTFNKTGMTALTEKYNIKLINFSEGGIKQHKIGKTEFIFTAYLEKVDAVINIAKYKTHSLMYYTGAVKNLYGLVPGLKKSDYHKENADYKSFGKIISGLHSLVNSKIVLNILDGITGMEGEGPSAGKQREFGVIFTSQSASALDFIAARMMGFKNNQMHYILEAMKHENIEPDDINLEPKWKSFQFKNVKHRKISLFIKLISISPGFLKKLFKKLYVYEPDFNEKCTLCRVCLESCPVQAIFLDGKMKIDYNKCIKCMCCHELCPYHAIYIRKSWLAKRLIK